MVVYGTVDGKKEGVKDKDESSSKRRGNLIMYRDKSSHVQKVILLLGPKCPELAFKTIIIPVGQASMNSCSWLYINFDDNDMIRGMSAPSM